jgi:putative phosphoribosyl transferase
MSTDQPENIIQIPEFRNRSRVFRDRKEAGEVLAGMLQSFIGTDTLIMAIPSGGVPVAAIIAERLKLPLEIAVVSKIILPWNTEAGYGAVAFDGTIRYNEDLLTHLRLSENQIEEGKQQTLLKVKRRVQKFQGDRSFPGLTGGKVILVDDGLASGFTMLVAIEALRKAGAESILVAVPTGSYRSIQKVSSQVDVLVCANIREGWQFAVADAYRNWRDVEEEEAVKIFRQYKRKEEFGSLKQTWGP